MATKKHRPSPSVEDSSEASSEAAEQVQAKNPPPPPSKNPPPATSNSNPKPPSSSLSVSGSDSGSESETDSEPEPEPEPTPRASKPMKVQTIPSLARSGTKRVTENNDTDSDYNSKRSKRKAIATEDHGSDNEKKAERDANKKIVGSGKEESVAKKNEGPVKDVEKRLAFTEMVRFSDEMGLPWFNMGSMKRGLELMGESNKAMLAEKWKEVHIAEMKVLMTRAELVRDQISTIMESYENCN